MNGQTMTKKSALLVCALMACALALCLSLTACGGGSGSSAAAGSYKDGTYTGESKVLDAGADGDGYAVVKVVVSGGKITEAECQAFKPDGSPKDSTYGKGTASYSLAQKIVSYIDDYEEALVKAGTPDGVDVISGATFLHDQFVEAANNALKQAKA